MIFNQQSNQLEFHCGKGAVVGRLLGKARSQRKVSYPKTIGKSTLTHEELSTLLTEIEGLINARPLTYVYDDEESISYPLTPSDLIYG